MENFIFEQNIVNDISGTNSLPIFAGIMPGKNNMGISICTKINSMLYLNNKKRQNKNNVLALRCKNHKNGCGWTGKSLIYPAVLQLLMIFSRLPIG